MANNKHIITHKPSDRGTAAELSEVTRRLNKLEGSYGVVGSGATITGPTIATEDAGAKVWIQSPDSGTAGLYGTDGSGNVVVSIIPGQGLGISAYVTAGTGIAVPDVNCVSWWDGNFLVGEVVGVHINGSGLAEAIVSSRSYSPNGIYLGRIWVSADNNNGASVMAAVGDGTSQIQIGDNNRNGIWPGSLTAASFVVSSDIARKETVEVLDKELTGELHKLRPVRYTLKNRLETHYGFIAQEVAEVLPEVVRTYANIDREENSDQPKEEMGISMGSLVSLLVATVQQQEHRIKELEDRWNKDKKSEA